MNKASGFIAHETVICDEGDPLWIKSRIKNLINDKKMLYKKYLCSGKNTEVFELLELKE